MSFCNWLSELIIFFIIAAPSLPYAGAIPAHLSHCCNKTPRGQTHALACRKNLCTMHCRHGCDWQGLFSRAITSKAPHTVGSLTRLQPGGCAIISALISAFCLALILLALILLPEQFKSYIAPTAACADVRYGGVSTVHLRG